METALTLENVKTVDAGSPYYSENKNAQNRVVKGLPVYSPRKMTKAEAQYIE